MEKIKKQTLFKIVVAFFIAVQIVSCKSDTDQIKKVSEKFSAFTLISNLNANERRSIKAVNYNVPQVINGECEVTVNLEDNSDDAAKRGDKQAVLYIKIRKYDKIGWAVCSWDIEHGSDVDKQPEWHNTLVPMTAESLDKLISKCDTTQGQTKGN